LRPGFLILEETEAGQWDVTWTAPTAEPQLVPHVRGHCSMERTSTQWSIGCPEGEGSSELVVRGIRKENTQVVVRVAPLEGEVQMMGMGFGSEPLPLALSAGGASASPPESGDSAAADTDAHGGDSSSFGFAKWVELGVEHILIGADHLLFVLGLVLLIATTRELLVTITSFTVAHSVTLGGASLGLFSLPSAPVEAVIALSIVLLAVELVRGDENSLSRRKPWLVAFGFGLLHGFGFAGVLGELGLPQDDIWMPLLGFNVGVELGQLAFVAAILFPVILLRKAPAWARAIPPYAIGTVAAAWVIERVAGFWTV